MKEARFKWAVAAMSAFVLTACGGGGDDASGTTSTNSAEGYWSGTSSNGWTVNLLVLENGETWGVYSSGNTIFGALQGQTRSSAGTFSGSGNDYYVPDRSMTPGSYSGTFTARSTIRATLSNGVTFNGTYSSAYDQAASLASVAGSYTGTGVSGYSSVQSTPITVSASGVVSMPSSLGCSASGSVTPRSSGKNVFNVSITFSGASCALGNGTTTTGVAYYDSSTQQLLSVALNSAKSDGFIFVGAKSTAR